MDCNLFFAEINMHQNKEFDRVKYVAFYLCQKNQTANFKLSEVLNILSSSGYGVSNVSRIKKYLKHSKDFRLVKVDEYSLLPKLRIQLEKECSKYINDNEIVVSEGLLLDESMFCGHRGFLTKLVKQANHSYENHCYDACAVILRRILEILLILCHEFNNIADEIRDQNGFYINLERICANAKNNPKLALSRVKNDLDEIRNLGNYSAHRIFYNATQKDIDDLKTKMRLCFEELLYKSGLKS